MTENCHFWHFFPEYCWRWETVIRGMIAEGVDTFVEIGPGKTLCGLIGRIDRSVRTFAAAGYDDLDALLTEVQLC